MRETEDNDEMLTERLIAEVLEARRPMDKRAKNVDWFVGLGGDKNARIYGKSLLTHAIKNNDVEIVKVLKKREAQEWEISREEAISLGKKLWMDVDYPVLRKEEELVELIKQGADVAVRDIIGATPLWNACYHGKEAKVKLLLESGADVNVCTKEEGGCVKAACYNGNRKIIEMLLEKGADVNIAGKYGWTALKHSAVKGDSEVVKKLIERGADADKNGEKRGKSLMLAVLNGHEEVVKILLEAGASLEIKDNDGKSVEDIAHMVGNEKIIDMIYEKKRNDFGMMVTDIENVNEFKSWMREQASRHYDRG